MTTIWKFELRITDVQRVEMPAGSRLLSVQGQRVEEWQPGIAMGVHDGLMLWAQVNPEQPKIERLIGIVGTGNPAPDIDDEGSVYVGSAQCGSFVWHVFDGGEHYPPEARRA